MTHKNLSIFFILCAATLSAMWCVPHAEAASISFRASTSVVHQGQEIAIDVLVDPAGQNVNTMAATVIIPEMLDFVGVDDSTSVIGLWVDEPVFNPKTRTLVMSGIVPGGFSGSIDPFNPSVYKPGVLIRLILRGRNPGSGLFSLPEVEAYINDGFGTRTSASGGSLPIVVDQLLQIGSADVSLDTTPPLAFTPVVERDVLLYDNKRVLIFNTKDKGSGMDHYEVKEGNAPWVEAVSPYVLLDQSMTGDILVKAVDRSGNERIEAIPGAHPLDRWQIVGVVVVFLLLLVLTLMRMSYRVHKNLEKK